ncbi:MAG TPA: hypothetical protein VGT98_14270 [Candidatus Elarobacter sp.]|nr:hypothetical protein [Candidatus Elarobacter sp.]
MDHIGENAELYALGVLSEHERRRTDDHVRQCIPCTELLGNAERIVADIEGAMPQRDPPRRLEERILRSARAVEIRRQKRPVQFRPALAALVLLGILSSLLGFRSLQVDGQLRKTEAIVVALSSGEFGQLYLRAGGTTGPIAKAICEKDGKWIYLVVAKTSPDLALYGERNGHREMLGRPVNEGESATLFVDRPGKFSALALVANGRGVAEAKTHYPQ